MRPRLTRLCLGLSLLFLLVITFACDNTRREEDPPGEPRWSDTQAKMATGPLFEDEDFALSVTAPKACKKAGPMAPAPGTERLSVPVNIRGRTARQIPVSALLFTLEDVEGHEVRPTLAGCAPSIPQTTVSRGIEVSGEVAFDVPLDFGTPELRYEPFLIGREKVIARVQVPPMAK